MKFTVKYPELNALQIAVLKADILDIIGADEQPINHKDIETFVENDLRGIQRQRLEAYFKEEL